MILFRVLKKEVESTLKNVFLKTGKEIRKFKEIEGIENFFRSEGFGDSAEEEWHNCNCHLRTSIASTLSYHLKYHLTKKENILKFGKNLLELINDLGKENKKRKSGEVTRKEWQEIRLESQIEVNHFPNKRQK